MNKCSIRVTGKTFVHNFERTLPECFEIVSWQLRCLQEGFFFYMSCTIASLRSSGLRSCEIFSPVLCSVKQQNSSPQTTWLWGVNLIWCSVSGSHLSRLHTEREAEIDLSFSEQMSPSSGSVFSICQPSRTPGFPRCRFWGDPVCLNTHARVTVHDTSFLRTHSCSSTRCYCAALRSRRRWWGEEVCVCVCVRTESFISFIKELPGDLQQLYLLTAAKSFMQKSTRTLNAPCKFCTEFCSDLQSGCFKENCTESLQIWVDRFHRKSVFFFFLLQILIPSRHQRSNMFDILSWFVTRHICCVRNDLKAC